jgi:8-oxo-dGTP diphosphatase
VVDVANVMGARADGWWRDRAGAALRLCREVLALAARETGPAGPPGPTGPAGPPGARTAAAWVLVLEGRARDAAERLNDPVPPADDAPPGADWVPPQAAAGATASAAPRPAASAVPVRVVSAPASGDDAIVGVVAEVTGRGESCLVVTADRELRRRCEALGAAVAGPGWLLRLLLPGSIGNLPSPMHRTMW